MNKRRFLSFLTMVAMPAMFATTGTATAQEPRQHAKAGDIDIYYGFLPAEVAGRVTAAHDDVPMHGRARRGDHHLMVALYGPTGERITDAEVIATVGELGLTGTRRTLDPMVVVDTTTFGNYFPMRNVGQYRVMLEIRLPGAARPVAVHFDHHHR